MSWFGVDRKTWMPGSSPGMTASFLWIKPHFRPRLTRRIAAKFDAVVQADRAVVPEFEAHRIDLPAVPAARARHLAERVFGGELGDRLLEGVAAFQRLRLLAGARTDLRLLRPCGEIGVGLGVGDG